MSEVQTTTAAATANGQADPDGIPSEPRWARTDYVVRQHSQREWWLQLAQDQSRHRMNLENRVIWNDIWRSWAGMVAGAFFAVSSTVGGCWLVYLNHDGAGAAIATVGVAGVVSAFIYGTSSQSLYAPRKRTISRPRG